jgi:hypothetical protein
MGAPEEPKEDQAEERNSYVLQLQNPGSVLRPRHFSVRGAPGTATRLVWEITTGNAMRAARLIGKRTGKRRPERDHSLDDGANVVQSRFGRQERFVFVLAETEVVPFCWTPEERESEVVLDCTQSARQSVSWEGRNN